MDDDILIQFITHGREERNLEYKGNVNWKTKSMQAKLIKTIMAFSNIPNGGAIVLGVEQKGERFVLAGLSADNFDSYKQDDISELVNSYADPYVELTVTKVPHEKSNFVIIQVNEFAELPIICKKNGPEGLKRGSIYVRPRRKNETVIIPSQVEMRELLNRAIDIGIQSLQKRLAGFGINELPALESDREKFDTQMGNL